MQLTCHAPNGRCYKPNSTNKVDFFVLNFLINQKLLLMIPKGFDVISFLENTKDPSTITLGESLNALQAQKHGRH